jgi:hypothetical protein
MIGRTLTWKGCHLSRITMQKLLMNRERSLPPLSSPTMLKASMVLKLQKKLISMLGLEFDNGAEVNPVAVDGVWI